MCHIKSMPKDKSKLIAPPLMGVMRHVKMAYPTKKSAVDFIVDYVQNPSKSKAICMPQKLARFGVMPSQKGNITPENLRKVASWMYDNYPPANFRGMGGNMSTKGMKAKGMNLNMRHRSTFEMIDSNHDGVITKKEFTDFQTKRMSMMKKQRKNSKQGNCPRVMSK
jgi:cytochrome c